MEVNWWKLFEIAYRSGDLLPLYDAIRSTARRTSMIPWDDREDFAHDLFIKAITRRVFFRWLLKESPGTFNLRFKRAVRTTAIDWYRRNRFYHLQDELPDETGLYQVPAEFCRAARQELEGIQNELTRDISKKIQHVLRLIEGNFRSDAIRTAQQAFLLLHIFLGDFVASSSDEEVLKVIGGQEVLKKLDLPFEQVGMLSIEEASWQLDISVAAINKKIRRIRELIRDRIILSNEVGNEGI